MTIDNKEFSGERPLFATQDLEMHRVTIHAGESALKHCCDIAASECVFEGKYPFWHDKRVKIINCVFREGARAAIVEEVQAVEDTTNLEKEVKKEKKEKRKRNTGRVIFNIIVWIFFIIVIVEAAIGIINMQKTL